PTCCSRSSTCSSGCEARGPTRLSHRPVARQGLPLRSAVVAPEPLVEVARCAWRAPGYANEVAAVERRRGKVEAEKVHGDSGGGIEARRGDQAGAMVEGAPGVRRAGSIEAARDSRRDQPARAVLRRRAQGDRGERR